MKVVVVRHCRHVTKNWADMAVFYQKMCACVSKTVSVYKKEEDVMKVSRWFVTGGRSPRPPRHWCCHISWRHRLLPDMLTHTHQHEDTKKVVLLSFIKNPCMNKMEEFIPSFWEKEKIVHKLGDVKVLALHLLSGCGLSVCLHVQPCTWEGSLQVFLPESKDMFVSVTGILNEIKSAG